MRTFLILLLLYVSCSGISQSINEHEKWEYQVLHYWDNYNFEDPYVFLDGDIMLGYFSCLRNVPNQISNESIHQTLEKASKNNQIFSLFIDTYRVYLLNSESFFCNYEKYLAVTDFVINNENISQSKKIDFELEKTAICTNRIGHKATDFTVVDGNNDSIRLYDIKSDYLLVFFQNPNCGICSETKEKLSNSTVVNDMIDAGQLNVLSVCPYDEYESWIASECPEKWLNGFDKEQIINREHLYYFFESSSLYLLDKDKTILMKDARLDFIEDYLKSPNP